MRKSLWIASLLVVTTGVLFVAVHAQQAASAPLTIWVKKNYSSWDNPLQSEFSINGKTVNIYTADTFEIVEEHFKPGWNTITIKTTPQEPASKGNHLILHIGPAAKDAGGKKMSMSPVLWQFFNGSDWKLAGGKYSHPLGPDVKEVTHTYNLYYAAAQPDETKLKAGDYLLNAQGNYAGWSAPVTATLWVNGTPLTSFTTASRQIIITPYLKQGKNEIKLVSHRVNNSIRDNDINFSILGPAEWNVTQGKFMLAPVVQFKAKQGWTLDSKSGKLINPMKTDSETIERVIPFMLKEVPKAGN